MKYQVFENNEPCSVIAQRCKLDESWHQDTSEDVRKAVGSVYKPAKLSYSNLNQAGVDSVSTQAQLVTRVWRGEDMQNKLKALRQCFTRNVPNIQDTVGSHAKWQDVKPADKGSWTYYELN